MDFDSNLKESLNNCYESIIVPNDLKQKVLKRVNNNKQRLNLTFTQKVIIVSLVVFLLTPVLAFGYSVLANQIYGSSESAKQYGVSDSEYLHFNSKLNEASRTLSPKEFAEFIPLAKDLIFFMLKNGDMSTSDRTKLGQVDVTKLTPDKQKEYNEILSKIQPYFDKLNHSEGIK
jgi:hypothetical protein